MVNSALFSSKSDDWATPADFFAVLNAEFRFDLDVCASEKNHKTPDYFDEKTDGLLQNWGGASGFLQSAIFADRKMDKKGVAGIIQTANVDRFTDSRANRYKIFS